MKIILFLITLFVGINLMPLSSSSAQENDKQYDGVYSSVKIYFIRWDRHIRMSPSPELVRNMRYLYIEINDHSIIPDIAKAIFKDDFENSGSNLEEPVAIVIDFIRSDGTIESLYANESYMYNKDFSKFKKMDNKLMDVICSKLYLKK
jgi:hypothetical protein